MNNSNKDNSNDDDDINITEFRYRFNDISVFEDDNPIVMLV